jgi:hypothetical protein
MTAAIPYSTASPIASIATLVPETSVTVYRIPGARDVHRLLLDLPHRVAGEVEEVPGVGADQMTQGGEDRPVDPLRRGLELCRREARAHVAHTQRGPHVVREGLVHQRAAHRGRTLPGLAFASRRSDGSRPALSLLPGSDGRLPATSKRRGGVEDVGPTRWVAHGRPRMVARRDPRARPAAVPRGVGARRGVGRAADHRRAAAGGRDAGTSGSRRRHPGAAAPVRSRRARSGRVRTTRPRPRRRGPGASTAHPAGRGGRC